MATWPVNVEYRAPLISTKYLSPGALLSNDSRRHSALSDSFAPRSFVPVMKSTGMWMSFHESAVVLRFAAIPGGENARTARMRESLMDSGGLPNVFIPPASSAVKAP